jgi:hypothetical protein
MGSPQLLGPWSVMQAKLHDGAAISRATGASCLAVSLAFFANAGVANERATDTASRIRILLHRTSCEAKTGLDETETTKVAEVESGC